MRILIVKVLYSFLAGMLLVRMFIIYHDFEHPCYSDKFKLALLLMKGFGLLILSPASIWKRCRDHHHKHNSKLFSASIGSYPVATKQKYFQRSRPERLNTWPPSLMEMNPLTVWLMGNIGYHYITISIPEFRFIGYPTLGTAYQNYRIEKELL